MKKLLPILGLLVCTYVNAQTTTSLPQSIYNTMLFASTEAEVKTMDGNLGLSMSDADIAKYIMDISVDKPCSEPIANISCMAHGSEIISGTIYLTKVGGAVVFNINGVEYVNALNSEAAEFFRSTPLTASL